MLCLQKVMKFSHLMARKLSCMRPDDVQWQPRQTGDGSHSRQPPAVHTGGSSRARPRGGDTTSGSSSSDDEGGDPTYGQEELWGSQLEDAPHATQVRLFKYLSTSTSPSIHLLI
jgi:hypothetical protein